MFNLSTTLTSLFAAALLQITISTARAEQADIEAPGEEQEAVHLLITYQANAENRPALWDYANGSWVRQLQAWQKEHAMEGFRVLINSYVEEYTWDAMLMLEFKDYSQVANWNAIEKRFPGGLDVAGLKIATPDHSYLVNRPYSRRLDSADANSGVYFVIPYIFTTEAEYERYAQVYVLPQFDGWIDAGILNGYEIFMNRHQTGKPWDVLLVLQYRDTTSFGERNTVKWSIREGLNQRPEWKLISDNKHDFREELETVIAEPIRH